MPEGEPDEVDGSAWDKLPPAPQATFLDWRDLPEPIRQHLDALEQFIGDVEGKDIGTCHDDHFIEDGTVDASDAVKAVNGLIVTVQSLRDLLRRAKNHVAESERADANPLWGEIHEALKPHPTQEQRVENLKLHGHAEGPKYAPAHKVR